MFSFGHNYLNFSGNNAVTSAASRYLLKYVRRWHVKVIKFPGEAEVDGIDRKQLGHASQILHIYNTHTAYKYDSYVWPSYCSHNKYGNGDGLSVGGNSVKVIAHKAEQF